MNQPSSVGIGKVLKERTDSEVGVIMVSFTEFRGKISLVGSLLVLFAAGPISQQEEELFLAGGFFVICMVVMLIISIMIAVWVYRDAKSRGMSGALWLIIVLIAGIIGLIIYLVVRHDKVPEGYYPPPQQYPPQYQQPYQQPPAQQPPAQPPEQPQQPGQTYDPETGQYK